MKFVKLFTVLTAVFALSACMGGAPKIDPLSMQIMSGDTEKVQIPRVCRSAYQSSAPRIAVLAFENHTTFGKMQVNNTSAKGNATRTNVSAGVSAYNRTHASASAHAYGYNPYSRRSASAHAYASKTKGSRAYINASKTNVKWSSNRDTFMRQVSPYVGEYAMTAVEDILINMGGINMFDRQNIGKIMKEHQFQMAVADPETAVKFGRLAGVSHLVVGSVDNISAKFIPRIKNAPRTNNDGANVALFLGTIAANTQTGWNVNVEITVKLVDVETGQVVISKKVKGREVGGSQPEFNPEMIVMAAKKAMGEAVADLRPEFSDKFSLVGYVTQLRGGKQAALVNIGKAKGLKPGQSFLAYDFIEITDPMTNAISCTKAAIPVKITVSNQVDENTAWVLIEPNKKNPGAASRIKLGTLIKRGKLKGQSFFKKLF